MLATLRSANSQLILLAWAQGFQALAGVLLTLALAFYGAANSDAMGLGLSLAARTLPTLLVALIGGAAADRWNRTKIAAGSVALGAIANAGLAIVIPLSGLDWKAQSLSLIAGFASAIGAPSLYALLPSIVGNDELVKGNAVVRTFRNTASALGPGLGAAVASLASFQFVLWAIVVCNALACVLLSQIKVASRAVKPTSFRRELAGLGSVLSENRWLLFAVPFWGLFLAIQSGAADVTQPLHVMDRHGTGVWSIMLTAMTIGYITGSLIAIKMKPRRLFTWSVVFGAFSISQLLASAHSGSTLVLICTSFVTGLGFEISGVLWGAALQSRVPEEHMGRAASFDYAISFGLTPIAYAAFGFFPIADAIPVLTLSAAVLGGLTVAGVFIGLILDAAYPRSGCFSLTLWAIDK
ncbi:MFS transporter [Trueperella bialowiezensis]|uniref:2-acyl-glycerophospho-ethanolamine acyltransferase n=1 Tax=Trueperella bialowiezensis TaxID=312285 RepID=A0A3S4V738_9ACTO|nr:MFS transporter [Trueperella bialowiezensis]VEI13487.1 2-acyl-glycerophospho-ethanolamine acyltransferase [Trueperella bialowiezensis]